MIGIHSSGMTFIYMSTMTCIKTHDIACTVTYMGDWTGKCLTAFYITIIKTPLEQCCSFQRHAEPKYCSGSSWWAYYENV